jgi:feruloyl esterase
MVNPMMASENPDLSAFHNNGGKIVMWQGWADQLIMPQGSVMYYDAVANVMGGYSALQPWYRHFMAPGVGHCGGGNGPQPQNLFQSVVDWVENGIAPDRIIASKSITGGTQTRPLCPYPAVAKYTGSGSTDDANNFVCAAP